MLRAQRIPWIAILLATLAGTSLADVAPKPAAKALRVPIDRETISVNCRRYSVLPVGSVSELLPWEQRLSLAACAQEVTLPQVTTADQLRPMLATLDHAMAPSIVIYKDARANGPAQVQILAAYGLGMTYVNTIVRARNTIVTSAPAFGGATYGGQAALLPSQALHLALEALLAGDRESALAAFQDVAQLAAGNPAAAHANVVVEAAIATARVEAVTLR